MTTPCAQGRCATGLRYAPTFCALLILDHFLNLRYCPACQIEQKNLRPLQNRDKTRSALISPPVQLLQRFPFHLQFHLRVLLERLRIPLPEQLRYPLVRHAPRRLREAERDSGMNPNTIGAQRSWHPDYEKSVRLRKEKPVRRVGEEERR